MCNWKQFLAPPQVGPNETLSAIVGKAVTLICDVKNEGPKSSITWLFNGKKELPSTAQTTPNAKKLIILSVDSEHTGAFECLVRNTAGESRKRFDLDVWAIPTFTGPQAAHEIQLIAGQEEFLKCPITGNPTPTIEWKRDNVAISEGVSADHQTLRIRQDEHGRHRYTCVATNDAGSVFRDFVVETITPPRLAGGGEAGGVQVIEVIQGHSATLDCPIATSQSAVKMDWIRDGREIERGTPRISIMADGTRLLMGNVQQEDESVFTCVAKNPAGEDSRSFKLVVLVPPRLDGAMVENIDIIEGNELDLECLFSANPDPSVGWTKNMGDLPEEFTLLNEDRSAYLEAATPSDAGAYQCRLTNAAGTAEKTFNVRVISAPKLLNSESTEVVEAPQGTPVTLKCPIASEADSNIEITWTHDKLPLSPDYIFSNGLSILADGYQLHLPKARVADAGAYACVAKNEAGESVKNFDLQVLVKPHILSDHGDFKVVENNTIVLPCEVDGSPTPDIVWTKDDKPAADLPDVAVLSGGQQFKILAANEEHQGKYKCTASNKVGSSDISFDVDVITRPTIAQSVRDVIETVEGDKAVFDCAVEDRDFDGEITWIKNYDPIVAGDKYTLMKGGRKLVVNNVDSGDEASYSCKVRNDAGTATVNYRLSVLVPPTIIMLEKDKNRTVVENSSLTLSCPATGKPEPTIRWFKDGELVLADNITAKIKSGKMRGNDLRIEGIMLVNGGTFTCEARNDAGVVEQDVNVYVMTPPVILRDNISSDIQGKRNSHAEIQCFSTGRPTPTVTWLKNGRPLENTRDVYLSSNHMRLHLTQLTDRHADKYTCIARNPAGEDKRDFTLTLLEAPKIDTSNLPKTIETNAGRTTSLSCPAVGHPEPAIHWLRDGMSLPSADDRFVFLNGGKTLQIKDLKPTDTARFMCMAENDVGFAEYSVDLRVIGPPEIKGHAIETIFGLINSPKELRCEVNGSQPITIEWLKAGRALGSEASAFIQATNQGQRLHLLSAQRGDSALYTCVAKNAAGEARKNFDFQVRIPPSINDSISSPLIQSALPEGDFKVQCIVDAVPEANITWLHNGKPLIADGVVTTLSNKNQTLFVKKADESHGGAYTCKAENQVGQTSRKYLVNLAAIPTFAASKETVNVHIGNHVTLNCKTNGGTGRISTTWLLNGRTAKQGNNSQTVHVDGKKVRINKIRFTDAGDYVCIAKNEAGEARKIYSVNVLGKSFQFSTTFTSISIQKSPASPINPTRPQLSS
uniref:Immunoglobulin I-set domain protein n=1 Tax=Panagrellus redivivus TaxID=6233 RepID=A0A7E4UTJ6_PANRE